MINARQRAILTAVVEDYINEATPVSSKGLRERYRFPVSSATIRNDLAALEEAGFLNHVYTSSGRVPTDQGYRFFVDELLAPAVNPADERALLQTTQEENFMPGDLCEALARRTRTFVEFWDARRTAAYTSGVTAVLEQPEFVDRASIVEFLKIADWLKSEASGFLRKLARAAAEAPQVFIGNELAAMAPRRRLAARLVGDFSLVVISLADDGQSAGLLVAAGPKRMVYPKVIGLFQWLKDSGLKAPAAFIISLTFGAGVWL